MNYRPAGYSSDEDDDEFAEFSFGGDVKSIKEKEAEQIIENYKTRLDINNTPENRLYNAILSGNLDLIRQALDNGTDVNCILVENYTMLLLAATHVNPDIIDELLKRGADPKISRDGFTALMAVCDCAQNCTTSAKVLEGVKKFLEYKVDAKGIDRKRRTALMLASQQGFSEVVQFLIPFSRLDSEDNQGWTALFYAVNANHPEIVKILIEAGSDINHTDVRLNDVKYYASINDYQEILEVLPKGEVELTPDDLMDKSASLENLFESLQKNERPLFMNDVALMLYGMQCEALIPLFQEKQIGLDKFLCLNDEELQEIGVKLSFQRDRIIKGLYKFHRHPFKQRSMPSVCTDTDYSTYDILITVANCIKHLTIMEASLKYMRKNLEQDEMTPEKIEPINEVTKNMSAKFQNVKYVTKLLQKAAIEFDAAVPNQPDLITKDFKFRKFNFKWLTLKWASFAGVSTLCLIYLLRNNYSS